MTIRKRKKQDTKVALLEAIATLNALLEGHNEQDAITCLNEAKESLKKSEPGTADFRTAINQIIDAFEDEHELMAYTYHRESTEWTEVEELAHASSRVISLARNFR